MRLPPTLLGIVLLSSSCRSPRPARAPEGTCVQVREIRTADAPSTDPPAALEWVADSCRVGDVSEQDREMLARNLDAVEPDARLTTRRIQPVSTMIGPGSGDVIDRFYRLDLPTPARARAAAALQPTDMSPLGEQSTFAPPVSWPIHPDSPNARIREQDRPSWWPAVSTAGQFWLWQSPATFDPCSNYRVSGVVLGVVGASVFHHRWHRQHFYPEGGCGG